VSFADALAISLAGALGSVARWGISVALNRGSAPWGTLLVNLVGALAIGAVVAALEVRGLGGSRWRAILTTGFLGGFTTFSALALETVVLIERRQFGWALGYLGATVIGGIVACALGAALVRR
jgi:CrcB protein